MTSIQLGLNTLPPPHEIQRKSSQTATLCYAETASFRR